MQATRRNSPRAAWAAISALGVGVALALSAAAALASSPVLDVEGMTFVSSSGSSNEVVIWSREATFETETDLAQLVDVRATVTTTQEDGGFEVTCERGELDLDKNNFYAAGNVVGETEQGRRFRADWVRYDHEAGVLFTDAPVLITEEAGTYRGGGFRYFVDEKRFQLLGGASVVQEP